jgi:hypothetical protein
VSGWYFGISFWQVASSGVSYLRWLEYDANNERANQLRFAPKK